MTVPVLSLVVLNWDQLERTRRCIASLRSNTDVPHELIVVDNGSDGPTASLLDEIADVSVLHPENRGFARGMNSGLKKASGEFVAFINNDTVFPAEWASRLIETFRNTDRCGITLPAVTAAGNRASVRSEPADRQTVFSPFSAIPSGVVYMADRTDALALGGFSETYPVASGEDLDLLFKFWANGRQVVLDERVLIEHESAVTVSAKLADRDELYSANRLLFADKWALSDPDTIPRLSDCSQSAFAANLETARVAGLWMGHWFRTLDRALSAEARLRRSKAASASQRPATRSGTARLRRVPGKIRRLLQSVTKRS